MGKGASMPMGHIKISVHLVYDVKQDGKRKARLVAGNHLIGPNLDTYYSRVTSLRALKMLVFSAELNEFVIGSVYAGENVFHCG
jgi:hypothetical protein